LSRIGDARLSDENGILCCSLLWFFIWKVLPAPLANNGRGFDVIPKVFILRESMAGVEPVTD
jgi:hypothetical protein